jgi:hypothetical protein
MLATSDLKTAPRFVRTAAAILAAAAHVFSEQGTAANLLRSSPAFAPDGTEITLIVGGSRVALACSRSRSPAPAPRRW